MPRTNYEEIRFKLAPPNSSPREYNGVLDSDEGSLTYIRFDGRPMQHQLSGLECRALKRGRAFLRNGAWFTGITS